MYIFESKDIFYKGKDKSFGLTNTTFAHFLPTFLILTSVIACIFFNSLAFQIPILFLLILNCFLVNYFFSFLRCKKQKTKKQKMKEKYKV